MARYVMRYTGVGTKPSKDVRRVAYHPRISVLDDTSKRMLLVEAPHQAIDSLVDDMPNWVASPDRTTSLPEPHPGKPTPRHSPT